MSSNTPQRSVSQHTRADGSTQTANRLGGKFDDKPGAGGTGAAADPFAQGAVDYRDIQRLNVAKFENAETDLHRLRRELEIQEGIRSEAAQRHWRAGVSASIEELASAHPEVASWRISVDNSGELDSGDYARVDGYTLRNGVVYDYGTVGAQRMSEETGDLEFFDRVGSMSGMVDDDGEEKIAGSINVTFDQETRVVAFTDPHQYQWSRDRDNPDWNTIAKWNIDDPEQGMGE